MPTTEKSPEFYKHYPALFCAYFPVVNKETNKILTSIYGYKSLFWALWQQRKTDILRLYKPKNACLLPLRYRLNNTVA